MCFTYAPSEFDGDSWIIYSPILKPSSALSIRSKIDYFFFFLIDYFDLELSSITLMGGEFGVFSIFVLNFPPWLMVLGDSMF